MSDRIPPLLHQGDSHLPGCEFIPFRQVREEMGEPARPDDPWYDQAGIEKCADGCPHLERAKAHGRKLAKEHGW